jgi:hypothetical protein
MSQSATGTIKLLTEKGQEIVEREYDTIPERNRILEGWRSRYGKHFNMLSYQIAPNISAFALEMLDRVEEIVTLREQGMTYKQIGGHFGIKGESVQETLVRYRPDMVGKYNQRFIPDNRGRKSAA